MSLDGTTFNNTAPDQTVTITGSGATTVSGTYPNFTISSTDTDTNTTYSAGTGLSLDGTTFSIGQAVATNSNVEFNNLTVNGAINHNGVSLNEITVTTSTTQITSLEIDQVIKINGAVNFVNGDANGWVTFLSYDNFAVGGSYLIQIYSHDTNAGTNGPWHYNYTYTGLMSWSTIGHTNDSDSSQEISLHGYGHARAGAEIPAIKLRTLSRSSSLTPELQIADAEGDKPNNTFNFSFRMRKML